MNAPNWHATGREYFEHLENPDVRSAMAVTERLVGGGQSVAAVVHEVLRPAQIEVGRRWQASEWTVADEHAASAVTEAALLAASGAAQRPRTATPGSVVLACPPGEWHTLPLRMVSEVLAEGGFQCHFLGASVPPSHLRAYLDKVQPFMVCLSSSSALSLDGAAAAIAAAHSVGVPVLAGGRGFGHDSHRASLAGADVWADDLPAAVDIIMGWPGGLVPSSPRVQACFASEPTTSEELAAVRTQVVTALRSEFTQLARYDAEQWARTHEDIDFIICFALVSVRFRDDRIFSEFASWLGDVLAARHVPPIVLRSSLLAIATAMARSRPEASALIRSAAGSHVVNADFQRA